MTSFSRRAIAGQESLGEKLRRLREEANVSLEHFASRVGIQPKYVRALEDGHYGRLPGEVYVRNFLRKYADAFHVSSEKLAALYEQERSLMRYVGPAVHPPQAVPETQMPDVHRIVKLLAALGVLGVVLVYLGMTVYRALTPPTLAITAPAHDLITHELSVTISGVAEKESLVRINGQEVITDATGHFTERIDLQAGLNVIKVSAKKQRSRERVEYRQVVVKAGTENVP